MPSLLCRGMPASAGTKPRMLKPVRVRQIASDLPRRVRATLRIEQQPRRFARARRHHHRLAPHLLLGARRLIDIRNGGDLAVAAVISSRAIAPVITVSLPVFIAGKIIAWLDENADAVWQPRPHCPQ